MSPTTRRRLLLVSLVLASGCAADPFGWEAQRRHEPLPAHFVIVEPAHLAAVCGRGNNGCAVRYLNRCEIFIPADAQPWLRTHELHHCAGFTHPKGSR